MSTINLPQSKIAKFLFTDTRLAGLWLLLRLYIGYEWLMAGWGKLTDENGVWIGAKAGTAINGFFIAALKKASGEHPAVSGWYAWFIENIALQHTVIFSYLIVFGEIAVGLGLIVGLFTALAAFFCAFLNFHFLFAGTVSINPLFALIEIFIILAWRTAGYWGLDYFLTKRRL